jgi:hypothetical protein
MHIAKDLLPRIPDAKRDRTLKHLLNNLTIKCIYKAGNAARQYEFSSSYVTMPPTIGSLQIGDANLRIKILYFTAHLATVS